MAVSEDVSEHFDFFAHVIWPEVATAISDGLGSVIFAAGRPDELHNVCHACLSGPDGFGSTTPQPTASSPCWSPLHRVLALSPRCASLRPMILSNGVGNFRCISNSGGKRSFLRSRVPSQRLVPQATSRSPKTLRLGRRCRPAGMTRSTFLNLPIGSGGYLCR